MLAACHKRQKCQPASFFFFNDTATTEIYTLSLHDALPIFALLLHAVIFLGIFQLHFRDGERRRIESSVPSGGGIGARSGEHTSELQSQSNLLCRLLLGKKKQSPLQRPPPRAYPRRHLPPKD